MSTLLKVRLYGDPILGQSAEDVLDIDQNIIDLTKQMIDIMYAEGGIGLAAPQIGISKAIFVYDLKDGKGPNAVINPVIVSAKNYRTVTEGCLSIPNESHEVLRAQTVVLNGLDLTGEEILLTADGVLAQVFAHEMDHLLGITIKDRKK